MQCIGKDPQSMGLVCELGTDLEICRAQLAPCSGLRPYTPPGAQHAVTVYQLVLGQGLKHRPFFLSLSAWLEEDDTAVSHQLFQSFDKSTPGVLRWT